jgi:Inorganic Pyrophosphatase
MARDVSWLEWRQEQLRKATASGGTQTPINPNFGMLGPTGQTPSYVPYNQRGNQPLGRPGMDGPADSESKYDNEEWVDPPPSFISDVNMRSNWWSPFQPITPYGGDTITSPRDWDYPVGYNLNYIQPRMEQYAILRGMRASWGVLATIIETRKDQLLRIPWTIQRKDKPRQKSEGVKVAQDFFAHPDKKFSYSQWSRALLDDLLVIDAPTLYMARNRSGQLVSAHVLNGATMFPLIDDAGRRPESIVRVTQDGTTYLKRQPAFQQIIKGLPMVDLDESQIMYVPMRPRPELPIFGYPATEQIFIEVSEAIKKTLYQVMFWTEGTIPDLIVTVPKEWSAHQIIQYQAHFDAMFSGAVRLKSKVRFVPGDMRPFDIKNSSGESLWSQRDETLIRLCCYAYSVSPTPFVRQSNRGTAQNAQQTAEEEGLYPLMSYWKDDIVDPVLRALGLPDLEFVFLPTPEPDAEKQAKIHDLYIKNGSRTRNEIRGELGLEPLAGGDVATVEIGNAVIPLQEAAAGNAMPMLGMAPGGNEDTKPKPQSKPQSKPPTTDTKPAVTPPTNTPQRGPKTPTAVQKLVEWFAKATPQQIQDAYDNAKGDLDSMSNLQRHGGNYPKGHVWFQGLNLSIENAPGSKRGERDQHGTKWEVTMPTGYGYIRGTVGADGDAVDCYVGKDPESTTVWVIDQNRVSKKKGKIKGFDEHKVMLGYSDLKLALHDYLASHFGDRGHDVLDKVTELSMQEFKEWLKTGDMHEPIADQGVGEVVYKHKDLEKLDTISTGTNLLGYSASGGQPQSNRPKRRKRVKRGPRWITLGA